jgi:hypothetical protein
MIIKKEETKTLNYENFRLMKKTSSAVAEAVKRYPPNFSIEHANFKGNGLQARDINLLLSLENQFSTLMILNLNENKLK